MSDFFITEDKTSFELEDGSVMILETEFNPIETLYLRSLITTEVDLVSLVTTSLELKSRI